MIILLSFHPGGIQTRIVSISGGCDGHNATLPGLTAGLPDFSLLNIPKRRKIYQIATKYIKWP
jgi:hypothetical protein